MLKFDRAMHAGALFREVPNERYTGDVDPETYYEYYHDSGDSECEHVPYDLKIRMFTPTIMSPPSETDVDAALPRLKEEFKAKRDADTTRYHIAVVKPRFTWMPEILVVLRPDEPVPTEYGPFVFTYHDDLGFRTADMFTFCYIRDRRAQYRYAVKSGGMFPDTDWIRHIHFMFMGYKNRILEKALDAAHYRRHHALVAWAKEWKS